MTPTRKSSTVKAGARSVTPVVSQNGESGSTLDDVLNMSQVVVESREAADKMQRRVTRSVQEIKADLPESQRDDAEIQARIAGADFESVQKQAERDERDFAHAMRAIHEVTEAMDVEFKSLVTPNTEEQGIVDAAKAEVARLEAEVQKAEVPSFWKTLPLIKQQQTKVLTQLRADLSAARLSVGTAETTMAAKLRQRLMDASMEQSVQEYVGLSEKTKGIMKARVLELDGQITILNDRRTYALKEKEGAAKKIEGLTATLKAKEEELANEQALLSALANGSTEYAIKEKLVSELMVEVEKTRSDREASLTYFQSKEAALKNLELGHLAAIKLRGRHQARILRLHSDTEERARMYPAHLLNMKTMSDQAFDKLIREIGVKTDQNISEANAQAIVAADNDFMEGIEEHPELLRRHESVSRALRTHFISMRGRTERMLKMVEEGYEGVTPGNGLFTAPKDSEADNAPAAGSNETM